MTIIEKSYSEVYVNIKKHLSKNMNIRTILQYTLKIHMSFRMSFIQNVIVK